MAKLKFVPLLLLLTQLGSAGGLCDTTGSLFQGIGYVEPASEIRELRFQMDGIIGTISVAEGQKVRKGEVLATLRNQAERSGVAIAERNLAVAKAKESLVRKGINAFRIEAARREVARCRAVHLYAKSEYERVKTLSSSRTVSKADYEKAESEFRQAESSLDAAQASLDALVNDVRPEDIAVAHAEVQLREAELAKASALLEQTSLESPVDGTIIRVVLREGEAARLQAAKPVLLVGDLSQLTVRLEVDERYVGRLKTGQRVEVRSRGLGDRAFEGHVSRVYETMGDRTVFSHAPDERKELEVIQVLVQMPSNFVAPAGMRVDGKFLDH